MPLIYDAHNPRAVMLHAYLNEYMHLEKIDHALHVVIGGDGFLLKTVRQHYRPDAIFVGLNCGRLGFLLNEVPDEPNRLPEMLEPERLKVITFPRIAMEVVDIHGQTHRAEALNDIYLERMTGQTCRLKILIDGTRVVEEMVCDGLILCTALGSTAYSFSAGGAICHPALEIIGVTPICPHVPRMAPMLVPLSARIDAEALGGEKRKVRAVADGVDYNEIVRVSVSDARSPVKLAFFADHDFTGTLVKKVLMNT